MLSVPSGFRSSAVARSVIDAENGLPGKNVAPPEATKIEPLKTTGLSAEKSTVKFWTPIRRSSNSRMPPKLILRGAARRRSTCASGWAAEDSARDAEREAGSRTTRPGIAEGPVRGAIVPRDAELREGDRGVLDAEQLLVGGAGGS